MPDCQFRSSRMSTTRFVAHAVYAPIYTSTSAHRTMTALTSPSACPESGQRLKCGRVESWGKGQDLGVLL
eukprot:1160780-Pelagomonas_calceolata.AAC.9